MWPFFLAAFLLDLLVLPLAVLCLLLPPLVAAKHKNQTSGVLLLPGSGMNTNEFWVGARLLRQALPDHLVTCFDYAQSAPAANIQQYAEKTLAHLQTLSAETGIKRWAVIGHSLGGLVAAQVLVLADSNRDNGFSVTALVTIASPWRGAPLLDVKATALRSCRSRMHPRHQQMQPGSAFLTDLTKNIEPSTYKLCCFGSVHDALVPEWYPETCYLESFSLFGHYSIVLSPGLWREVAAFVKLREQSNRR